MKRMIFIFFVLLWMQTEASPSGLFRYDVVRVAKSFINADALDHYVSMHRESFDLSGLKSSPLLYNYSSESINLFDKGPDELLGIPAFWWGFILGVVGILLVYFLSDQNKEYVKDALIGCVASGLLYAGFWFLWGGCWHWYW